MTTITKNIILVSTIVAGLLATTILAILSTAEAQRIRPYPPIEPALSDYQEFRYLMKIWQLMKGYIPTMTLTIQSIGDLPHSQGLC